MNMSRDDSVTGITRRRGFHERMPLQGFFLFTAFILVVCYAFAATSGNKGVDAFGWFFILLLTGLLVWMDKDVLKRRH